MLLFRGWSYKTVNETKTRVHIHARMCVYIYILTASMIMRLSFVISRSSALLRARKSSAVVGFLFSTRFSHCAMLLDTINFFFLLQIDEEYDSIKEKRIPQSCLRKKGFVSPVFVFFFC